MTIIVEGQGKDRMQKKKNIRERSKKKKIVLWRVYNCKCNWDEKTCIMSNYMSTFEHLHGTDIAWEKNVT